MDIEVSQTHPNPTPNSHHRKIDLQSYADLTYLQRNLARSARDKLDLHFPPINPASAPATFISLGNSNTIEQDKASLQPNTSNNATEEQEDPLRARVRILVDSFLKQTWENAQQNIAVNGIEAAPLDVLHLPNCTNPSPAIDADPIPSEQEEREGVHFTYAAFDPKLQRKLASLHGELESLTAQVSKLRRTAPQKGADAYKQQLEQHMNADEEDWERQQQQQQQSEHHSENVLQLENVPKGWNEDVREIFEQGVSELAALSGVARKEDASQDSKASGGSFTEIVGKAQRARTVAMDFE